MRGARAVLVVALVASCTHHARDDDRDDEVEERAEREAGDNFWRARIAIVGQGRVATTDTTFDCASDGTTARGACGPVLVRFDELHPPLMRATGARGWRFDHWESQTRSATGALTRRAGPMPDGRLYLNGFGYRDTGAVETVFALFEPVSDFAGDLDDDQDGRSRK